MEDIKEYNYMICHNRECDARLTPPYDNYKTNIKKKGIKHTIYKCPYCSYEFTVDDLLVNAIDVTGSEKDQFIFVNQDITKIKGIYDQRSMVKVLDRIYINIPRIMFDNTRLFNIPSNIEKENILSYLNSIIDKQHYFNKGNKKWEV